MAVVKANVTTGLTTGYQSFFAQVRNSVIRCNGIDSNGLYHLEKGNLALGMSVPAAPSVATNGVGLTGNYRYRVKWHDRITGTYSISSSATSITLTNQGARITQPASPPSRATHWIVERVTASGSVFFPVNVNTTTPYGTVIATTTYDDTLTDQLMRNVTVIPNTQAIPPVMRYVFAHNNRVFGMGGLVYSATVTTTNGSANVTGSGSNFTTNQEDMFFVIVGSTTGKIYRILSRSSATAITLTENIQSGDVVTSGTALIFPYRNRLWWSEAGAPEHFGKQEAGGPANEIGLGARGESLVSGCSMGQNGVLVASDKTLYYLSYTDDPSPILGDGNVVPLPTKRHAAGPLCLKFVEGYVYGMDRFGIWRMAPRGKPEDISTPLQFDFKAAHFTICNSEKWHIQYDAHKHWVKFYVTQTGSSYTTPTKAFCWDVTSEQWVSEKDYPLGITSGCEIEDKRGQLRTGLWQMAPSSVSNVPSVFLCDDEATIYGNPPGVSPLTGNPTAGTTLTVTDSAASWSTVRTGSMITVYDASGAIYETRIVRSATATVITVDVAFSFTPAVADTYWIGPVFTKVRTGQMTGGDPLRKKKWIGVYIPVKYKSSAVPFKVRAYYDHATTANADQTFTDLIDGVTITASSADKTVDSTVNEFVYFVPLNGVWAHSLTLEFYSYTAGLPWEINGAITVDYENDPSFTPATKATS